MVGPTHQQPLTQSSGSSNTSTSPRAVGSTKVGRIGGATTGKPKYKG